MDGFRRGIATVAMALSLSGCLTLMGTTVGGIHASSSNNAIEVQQGYKPRASVGKWMAAGAGIGFVLDVALAALVVSQDSGTGGGRFGH